MEPSGVTLSVRHLRAPAVVVALIVVLAAACQGPAPTPSAAPAATTPPARATAPAPAATAAPSAGLPGPIKVVGTAPVITRSMFPGRTATLPGAISVAADGTYHAWVIAFAQTPGTQEIHYLTSPDALTWTEVPDASLEGLSEGLGNPGALPTSVLEDGDGWVMYYVGTLATEQRGWDLWRATAPTAAGPWTRGDEPVMRRGPADAWDSGALDFPTVLATDDGYTMVYSGWDPAVPDGGSIGFATSDDGIAWTKLDDPATTAAPFAESDPIVEPGLCGGFDDRAVQQPRVVALPDRLVMAYAGYTGPLESRATVGYADSLDGGRTWTCAWPGPALDTAGLPDGFVHTLTAFHHGERAALLVEWFANGGTDIWLADLGVSPP